MIAWNAFITYIFTPAENIKVIAFLILLAALLLRRTRTLRGFFDYIYGASYDNALFVILIAAFLLRLGWVMWSPHVPPAAITEDAYILRHATEIANGDGFISLEGHYTARRPIGYPLFLAILIKLFGNDLFVPQLFQVGFGVLVVFCLFALGSRLGSQTFGFLAAFLYTFYPTAVMSTKIIMDEHLFILLWLLSTLFLVADYEEPSYKKVIVAGLCLGISAIFRTYSLITVPIAFLVWFFVKGDFLKAFFRGVILASLVILCAAPWAIRNYYRLGSPIFYTSLLGVHLYYANNPTSDVRYPINPGLDKGGDKAFLTAQTEPERDKAGQRAAFHWIKQHPGLFLQKAVGRVCYMLGFNNEGWVVEDNFKTVEPQSRVPSPKLRKKLEKWEQYYYVFVFIFACVGMAIYFVDLRETRDSRGMSYLVLSVIFYVITTGIGLNHRKYRFVIEPLLCVLAAYGLLGSFSLNLRERMTLSFKKA